MKVKDTGSFNSETEVNRLLPKVDTSTSLHGATLKRLPFEGFIMLITNLMH